jgi:DNA repair protein SbcC/Rad50
MKLARLLFKPKWQDKNPDVRRRAIASDDDAELIAALPDLVRADADPASRVAALRRLHDYEAWRERSTGDADGEVRRVAREAYLALLCSRDERVPPLARRIAELETLSPAEIERVAAQAVDRELRASALARVSRQALLVDRALKDPDAGLRASVLDRIDSAAVLERIAETARKTDKNVSRRARELAATLRIDSGNVEAIALKAQELCARMESLMRAAGGTEQDVDDIERAWTRLGEQATDDTRARYLGALAVVRRMQLQARTPKPAIEPPLGTAPAPAAPSATLLNVPLSVDLIASQARFDAALATAANEAQSEREARRTRIHEIERLVARLAADLESGDVAGAQRSRSAIVPLADAVDTLPPALGERLAGLHARHDELRHWHQWANQQRREAICEGLESLAAANPHPDALATGVRDAREEWRRLDAAEGVAANETRLSRRFNALCHRALKPAKGYFDKRDQLRRTRTDEVESLLRNAAAMPEAIGDWKAATTLRRDLAAALHGLDAVDPRERTNLAKRIKDAIASLAPRLETYERGIEAAKRRLIERASALTGTDGRSAARQVQDLQREWTALGHARRGTDQKQWQEFRRACDAVFSSLDAARKERDTQETAVKETTQAILRDLEALNGAGKPPRAEIKAALREIDHRWQALAHRERETDQRYRKLVENIESTLRDAARNDRLARFHDALAQYRLLRGAEIAPDAAPIEAGAEWNDAANATDAMAQALSARRARISTGNAGPTDEEAARDRLVELEFIAGVETPADDRQRRMNYQVHRLASRMRDRATTSPEMELVLVLAAWFAQTPQREELETRFLRAAQAGVASLP